MIKQKRHKLQPNLRYPYFPIGTRVRVNMDILGTDNATGRVKVRFAAGAIGEVVSRIMFGKYEVRFEDGAPVRIHASRLSRMGANDER